MSIHLEWEESSATWLITVGETFTLDEVVSLIEKTDWKGAKHFLWDLRDLRDGPSSPAEIVEAAKLVETSKNLWRGGHAAIVVSRELDFGVGRMFQVFAEDAEVEYRVGRSREEAIEWLSKVGRGS